MPTFSVIVPTYNGEKFIKMAITSVLNQTFTDFELIVIDDGSMDTTPHILKEFEKIDTRIKIITTTNSGGPTIPTNIGLHRTQGNYVTFLDHDDIWKSNKLEILNKAFSENPEIGFIATNVEILNEKDSTLMTTNAPIQENKISTKNILSGNYFNTFSMLAIKREILDRVGYLDTNLFVFADYDMVVRMVTHDVQFLFLPEALTTYRVHQNNSSSFNKSAIRRIQDLERITLKYQEKFNAHKKSLSTIMQAMARIYLNLGDKKSAIIYFKKAAQNNPSNPAVYIRLFLAYFGEKPYRFFRKIKNETLRKVS